MINAKSILEIQIAAYKKIGFPALMENFILRNGKEYEPIKSTAKLGKPKLCFMNAYRLSQTGIGKYTEGFVVIKGIPLLILHAWVDVNGKAMDNTLKDSLDCGYYGVAFDESVVTTEIFRLGHYGILDTPSGINTKFIFAQDPNLEKEFEKFRKARQI